MSQTRAPYRIFDCGGWTDTSFMPGGSGECCNVAVNLYVHIEFTPDSSEVLHIKHLTNGQEESVSLPFIDAPQTLAQAAAKALSLGAEAGGVVTVRSDVPPGSGLGGSASYSVALLAALQPQLLSDKHKLASIAQELETKWLGNSCGTQDQMAASFGGASYSQITYPQFTQEAIVLSDPLRRNLEAQLLLVYTGEAHFSSAMHQTVVTELQNNNETVVNAFHTLKTCAYEAADMLKRGDLDGYKAVLNKNWAAQKQLHSGITTETIEALHHLTLTIDTKAAFKGSGAGGGGSVAILVPAEKRQALADAVKEQFPYMMVWDSLVIDTSGACNPPAEMLLAQETTQLADQSYSV
jgi:D-glycero-alpha-D-manno-heptose-7-phosphate kinase